METFSAEAPPLAVTKDEIEPQLTDSCVIHIYVYEHMGLLYYWRLTVWCISILYLCTPVELYLFGCVFFRLESRISADIGIIMQLLQRQIPMIPPSYSTLTSTPNTPSTPIMCPTAASLTDKSSSKNPQQQLSDEVLQQLPEYESLHCDSTVLHFTSTTLSSMPHWILLYISHWFLHPTYPSAPPPFQPCLNCRNSLPPLSLLIQKILVCHPFMRRPYPHPSPP